MLIIGALIARRSMRRLRRAAAQQAGLGTVVAALVVSVGDSWAGVPGGPTAIELRERLPGGVRLVVSTTTLSIWTTREFELIERVPYGSVRALVMTSSTADLSGNGGRDADLLPMGPASGTTMVLHFPDNSYLRLGGMLGEEAGVFHDLFRRIADVPRHQVLALAADPGGLRTVDELAVALGYSVRKLTGIVEKLILSGSLISSLDGVEVTTRGREQLEQRARDLGEDLRPHLTRH